MLAARLVNKRAAFVYNERGWLRTSTADLSKMELHGSTRVTFETKTSSAVIYQQDDYMPFGMEISRGLTPNPQNEYLYNGKELQEEFGQYDYGARFYDPVIARWNVPDPDAENMKVHHRPLMF